MKFLFLFPFIANASETTNFEQILSDLLKIASGIPGKIGAIFVAFVLVIYSIFTLSKAISSIAEYFKTRKEREEEIYRKNSEEKKNQMIAQSKRENDNYLATMSSIEEAWGAKLERCVQLLKNNNTLDVLKMIPHEKTNEANIIIYDTSMSTEYRAVKVIELIRKKS